MSFFKQVGKGIFEKLFRRKSAQILSEQPTRPLDAAALARALTGEGRRHISTGYAMLIPPQISKQTSSLYLLMAKSDGLNMLPDFGIVGVAECHSTEATKSNLSKAVLTTFAYQMTQKVVLDCLELEGFGNSRPLQNVVVETMEIIDQVVQGMGPGAKYSLTAGLMFAEIMILGHCGRTRAYHIDRHHIERITASDVDPVGSMITSISHESESNNLKSGEFISEKVEDIIVYSRPVPRDGAILLCTSGLWSRMSERDIHEIVMGEEDPQEACRILLSQIPENNSYPEISVLLIYFPPDFGTWR